MSSRVAVIGLDCAEPRLVFERWREELPNLSRLMDRGHLGAAPERRPADHRAGVELHDDGPRPG